MCRTPRERVARGLRRTRYSCPASWNVISLQTESYSRCKLEPISAADTSNRWHRQLGSRVGSDPLRCDDERFRKGSATAARIDTPPRAVGARHRPGHRPVGLASWRARLRGIPGLARWPQLEAG